MGRPWRRLRLPPWLAALLIVLLLGITGVVGWRIVEELQALRHFRAAQAALETEDFAAARSHLEHCLKVWPDSGETHFLAARAARRNGDLADAYRFLDAAEKRGWVPEAILLERELIRVPLGELLEVEKYLSSCVTGKHPDSDLIVEVLAPAYLRNYQLGAARHYAKQWTELRPDSAAAWLCRGAVAERQRNSPVALDAYRHAVECSPEAREPRLRLIAALLDAYESTEALEHVEHLRQRFPDDPVVRRELARCLSLRGEFDAARKLLVKVLADLPDDAKALTARGRLEVRAGRPAQAERWLRQAAERVPFDREVVFPFIQCLRKVGKNDEAARWDERLKKAELDRAQLDKAAQQAAKAPRDPEPRCRAGVILLRNGMEDEGVRWLVAALHQDPDHAATHRALADYFERKGQPGRAAAHRAVAERKKAGEVGLPSLRP
jgi:Tfp pilus assembly protein PilF